MPSRSSAPSFTPACKPRACSSLARAALAVRAPALTAPPKPPPLPSLTLHPPPSAAGELLKCLVLTGFRDLEVGDLDTIDVSNLSIEDLEMLEKVFGATDDGN